MFYSLIYKHLHSLADHASGNVLENFRFRRAFVQLKLLLLPFPRKGLEAVGSWASESFQYLFVLKERSAWPGLKVKWKVNPAFTCQPGRPWGILCGLSLSIFFSVIGIRFVPTSQRSLSSQILPVSAAVSFDCGSCVCPLHGQPATQVRTLIFSDFQYPWPSRGKVCGRLLRSVR